MKRIIPYLFKLTIITMALSSTHASLSVFTKGNPRTYILKDSKSTPSIKEAQLYFEGPDLKKAFFLFEKDGGLFCKKARIIASEGLFECEGYLKKDEGSKKEDLTFKFSLEPIKDGFNLKGDLKKQSINLKISFKKK